MENRVRVSKNRVLRGGGGRKHAPPCQGSEMGGSRSTYKVVNAHRVEMRINGESSLGRNKRS
jgi:hypothetical protein